nr:MAG TPA: hypothetical protein [Caudoviricetes sp.]
MKNWEFYEEQIKKCNFDFGIEDNEIFACSDKPCSRCYFSSIHDLCEKSRIKFLYQEHKELVNLTDDEKALCKLLGRGWIARDKNNMLWWYENKPTANNGHAGCNSKGSLCSMLNKLFSQCEFDFIKWEDGEPWEVQVDD